MPMLNSPGNTKISKQKDQQPTGITMQASVPARLNSTPTNLAEVADRIALQDVMLRYAIGVDERDMELYASCFADNVEVVDFAPEPIIGRDNMVQFVTEALEKYGATQHMLGPQYAEIDGDTATTRSDVQALHYLIDDPEKTLTLWATYNTQMQRIDGRWQITRHQLAARGTKIG